MNNTDWFYSGEQFQDFFRKSNQSLILKANPPYFTILAVSDKYLAITHKQRNEVLNKNLFDVFPGSQTDAAEQFTAISSFQRVIKTKTQDELPTFKYEIFVPKTGKMEVQYWHNLNEPILDSEDNVAYIINTTANITELVINQQAAEDARQQKEALSREQALNEKLLAANAELSEMNKELQHTQQSLRTLNNELEERVIKRTKQLSENEARLRYILADAPVTICVLTGWDMVIESANKKTLEFLEKDESIIGKPLHEALPEMAGQPFIPIFREVLTTGKPFLADEIPVLLQRHNKLTKGYFNVVFQPITDETGTPHSIIIVAMHVTEQVKARLKVQALNEELSAINKEMMLTNEALATTQQHLRGVVANLTASESKMRNLITHAPVAIGVLKSRALIIETANAKLLDFWGRSNVVINMPLAEALPELKGQPFLQILDDVFTTGKPYYNYEMPAMLEYNGALRKIYLDLLYHPLQNEWGLTENILVVATDITEKVLARQKVEHAEEMLRIAIDAAELGFYYINIATREFFSSPRLKEFFGYARDEDVPYEAAIQQIHPDYREAVATLVEDAITKGSHFDIEYPVIGYRTGKTRWVRGIGTVQHNSVGKDSYFTGVLHEITERRQDEIRKNDFISMVSHELKTPLTSLSGYVQILQSRAQKAEDSFAINVLGKAYHQAKRMKTMINGFLNLSRLESGKIQIDKKRFVMGELIEEMIAEVAVIQPGHAVHLQKCHELTVNADRDKIGSVISNYLSNAIKYSPEGKSIEIKCDMVDGMVQVSVRDEGIGISAEHLDKLFDRFYRVGSDESIAGFGIGLYLSAEIIQCHHGKTWVESELGKGSTFFFSLPLD